MGRETKHFETLDALRGVAALAILIFHLGSNHVSGNFVPKAYLAVDFFFLLSGFVIARAYETSLVADRDIQLFLKRRAIRLYPLILLATILGFVAEASKAAFLHSADAMPLSALPAELVCGLLMIPYLGAGSGAIFPLVIPVWSLFLEIIANLLYALAARLLSMNRLVVFIICAALGFICVNQHYGNADEGFARSDVLAGMIRVLLSFFLGVWLSGLHRRKLFDRLPRVSGLWLAPILVISFLPSTHFLGAWYDPILVMLVFPAIVIAGCLDQLPPWLRPLARSLGALSYPVYVLQWPTICRTGYRLFYGRHGIDFAVGYALDIAAILTIAWFALKLYDAPVRHFLTATFILKGKTKPGVSAMPLAGDEQPF